MRKGVLAVVLAASFWTGSVLAQDGWYPHIVDACAVHGCDPDYLYSIVLCESGGDPNAYHANPNGGADVGLLQINDATWGDIAYADGVTQIWWAAAHLGSVWWACG